MGLHLTGPWIYAVYVLIPILMIIFGAWLATSPPKKPQLGAGYRTPMSLKNKDIWIFANKYSGKLFIVFGVIALIGSVLADIFLLRNDNEAGKVGTFGIILFGVQFLLILIIVILTETALRANFDKAGNRK